VTPPGWRAVLFDWDGTLADTAALSLRTYAALFESFGIPFGPAEFARTYSPNWYLTFEAMGLPRERWDEADARWLELYARETAGLLPGASQGLRRLRERGVRQGLVTSGTRSRIEADLARLALVDFFGVVVCGGDTPNRKPHPEPLLVALDHLGVAPSEAAYVGDSPEDVEMARAAGVYCVGIPGGFPNREALEASRPDRLAGTLEEAVSDLLG